MFLIYLLIYKEGKLIHMEETNKKVSDYNELAEDFAGLLKKHDADVVIPITGFTNKLPEVE